MSSTPPYYHGSAVKEITDEPGGLTLWVQLLETGVPHGYLRHEAVALLKAHPAGLIFNELTDALALCPAVTAPLKPAPIRARKRATPPAQFGDSPGTEPDVGGHRGRHDHRPGTADVLSRPGP
jgi:hypothetical protein